MRIHSLKRTLTYGSSLFGLFVASALWAFVAQSRRVDELLVDSASGGIDPSRVEAWHGEQLLLFLIGGLLLLLGAAVPVLLYRAIVQALQAAHAALVASGGKRKEAEDGSWEFEEISELARAVDRIVVRMRERERGLQAIVEAEPGCAMRISADGQVLEMNLSGLAMFEAEGFERVRGIDFLSLVHPEWRDRFRDMHAAVIAGEPQRLVFKGKGLQGTERWIETHAVAFTENSGQVVHLAVMRDISSRRIQEREIIAAKDAAEAANRAKSEFLANMSHEIRTPMTAILGYAELLLEEDMTKEDLVARVQTIRRNGDHLLSLINDILDISKIEAGKLEVERIETSVVQVIDEVKTLMAARAAERKLGLVVELRGDLPPVLRSDPVRLRQILVNLVGNGIKFTEHGEVCIRAEALTDAHDEVTLVITVADTGIGMDTGQLTNLFRSFSQGDTSTTRRFGGTGLGLHISRRLAQALGGEIEVASEPGVGSRFTLTLPLGSASEVALVDPATIEVPKPTPRRVTAVAGRVLEDVTILLADDGRDNQLLISHVLQRAGAEVDVVDNGAVALACAAAKDYDLILLDMQMPVLDGYATARELRKRGWEGPVVALTAHAMSGDRERCLAAGCDDYAKKPVSREVLIATCLGNLVRRSTARVS